MILKLGENKISVIIYLKNLLKRKVDEDALKKNECLEILKFYSEFVVTNTLNKKFIEYISVTFTSILNYKVLGDESKLISFTKSRKTSPRLNKPFYQGI